jgi:hypothetical protein
MDLVDMQQLSGQNKGHKFILTVIDLFSKYAFAEPIKHKTGANVAEALERIFQTRIPAYTQSDRGLEFLNKSVQDLLKKYNVQWFSTENETKAQIVERFNRTLKGKMFKYFTANNTKSWIDVLQSLVKNYNTSVHRTIKMTPTDASLPKNADIVFNRLYSSKAKKIKPRYKVNDKVRIYKKEGDFRRGYTPNFTDEVFTICKVNLTKPPTYVIKDKANETIIGSFYEPELSRAA